MPKERIFGSGDRHVVVGWSHERGVQVGMDSGVDIVIDGETFQSLWADLDRQGCNDLIRILRRARDSAFGRDE